MKFVEPKIEIIAQEPGIEGIYKQIELAGRTCYKSEANITDDSAKKFVERMIASHHTAMLEHGTMYFDITLGTPTNDPEYMSKSTIIQFFKHNKYSVVNKYRKLHRIDNKTMVNVEHYAITTNYRVFIEQIPWDKLGPMRKSKLEGFDLGLDKDYVLSFLCEPNEHHEKRITIKMYTDRGVTAEANRHRAASPAEQSTRYCNYSKEKYGKEIAIASNADISFEEANKALSDFINEWGSEHILEHLCNHIVNGTDNELGIVETWLFTNLMCEWGYMKLLDLGWTAQQARRVLPLDLHSELVHTAYESDWQHFIDLRSDGTTGKPHPDMKIIGDLINEKLNENK